MVEDPEARLKRLKMRSMRRGIKEMDLVLGSFADVSLRGLSEDDLDVYDSLLSENDHDIYQWLSGQTATPAAYLGLITRISAHQASLFGTY